MLQLLFVCIVLQGGFGFVDGKIDVFDPVDPLKKIDAIYINVEASVNRARYMPQVCELSYNMVEQVGFQHIVVFLFVCHSHT